MTGHTQSALTLRVVETISAAGGTVNDDRAGFRGNVIWVIDGATDCTPDKYLPGESDAAWLAERFHRHLFCHDGLEAKPLLDVISEVTRLVSSDFDREKLRNLDDRGHQPSAAGLIGRLAAGVLELAGLGDCQLFLATPGRPARLCGADRSRLGDKAAIDRLKAAVRQHNIDWQTARSLSQGSGAKSRRAMNVPGGYSVLSIDMAPLSLIHREEIAVAAGTRLLWATDGFARLHDVFGVYSEETLLEAAFERGLAALIAELRALENADPKCERSPRVKRHDDATAILAIVQ